MNCGEKDGPPIDIGLVPVGPVMEDVSLEMLSQLLKEMPLNYLESVISSACLLADQTLLTVLNSYKSRLGLDDDDYERGISVLGRRLSDELSYQFDKLELYALTSVFTVPSKLTDLTLKQNSEALSDYTSEARSFQKAIDDVQRKIVATRKLENFLTMQIMNMKNHLKIAKFQRKVVLKMLPNIQNTEDGAFLCRDFKKLLCLLETSISLSDALDSRLMNTSINKIIEQKDQKLRYYTNTVLKAMESTLAGFLKLPYCYDSKTNSEIDMDPLNEYETYRYSSEYSRLSKTREPGALKFWEDIFS